MMGDHFKDRIGYEEGDRRYDDVGRKKGRIAVEAQKCNNSPNTLAYLTWITEKEQNKEKKHKDLEEPEL